MSVNASSAPLSAARSAQPRPFEAQAEMISASEPERHSARSVGRPAVLSASIRVRCERPADFCRSESVSSRHRGAAKMVRVGVAERMQRSAPRFARRPSRRSPSTGPTYAGPYERKQAPRLGCRAPAAQRFAVPTGARRAQPCDREAREGFAVPVDVESSKRLTGSFRCGSNRKVSYDFFIQFMGPTGWSAGCHSLRCARTAEEPGGLFRGEKISALDRRSNW